MIPQNLIRDMLDACFPLEAVTRVTGILVNVCNAAGPPKRWQLFSAAGYISVEWQRGGRSLMVTVGKDTDSNPVAKCLEVPAFPCGDGVDPAEALGRMGQWLAEAESDEEYDKKFECSLVNSQ